MIQNTEHYNKYRVIPASVDLNSVRFGSVDERMKYKVTHPALDADGPNPFSKALGITRTLSEDVNLNYWWNMRGCFITITSFEVIEHLQNPLLYLKCIHTHLKNGGKLYLTTPVKWMFKGKYHFHEFTKEELLFCLIEAGFKNISVNRIQAYDLKHFGIRPIIRKLRDMIWGQCFFVTAIKGRKI